jgi:hypothetical protein
MHLRHISLLAIGLSAIPVHANTLSAKVNVDNEFDAYISTNDSVTGTLIGGGTSWPTTYTFSTVLNPGQDYYLHIFARDLGAPAGFLGQFSLSTMDHSFVNAGQYLLTQPSAFQVSSTAFGGPYVTPSDLGANGVSPWGNIGNVDSAARWIWHPNTNTGRHYFSTKITAAVPEPASGVALAGLLGVWLRRKKKTSR